jgi:hypothetical protein
VQQARRRTSASSVWCVRAAIGCGNAWLIIMMSNPDVPVVVVSIAGSVSWSIHLGV